MADISGKLALVTGASSGIGMSTARLLAENGVNLIITARRESRLRVLALELNNVNVYPFVLDVTDRVAVFDFANRLEQQSLIPDILINNAGLSVGKDPIYSADIDDWERMIDTNVKGFLYVVRAIIPMMLKRGSGHIINLGSIAGEQVYTGGNVYNATKFAVNALSKAMNVDLLDSRLRVCNIAPGMVNTEFSTVRYKGDKAKADKVYEGFTSLTGEDIADAILYVLKTPPHVNIQYILITPTAQRSVSAVNANNII
jgi:NADP-dependent 3-hydroxy acid dehydrogenase YdfG